MSFIIPNKINLNGCDGSVLLDGSASRPSEQDAPPNLILRAKAFEIINDLRERVRKECGRVVSCADLVALAARDSVFLVCFSSTLYVCPPTGFNHTTVLDIRSANKFDNKYYVDLVNRQGLFTSDQDLYTDPGTKDIVEIFAADETLFFEKFVHSMIKMEQLSVLTGKQGEIRANCSVRNSDHKLLTSAVEDEAEEAWSELK
ncbi:hypothetical protein SLEP1_g47591 [Rubroshorea leprosula]|uniref:peroxidase n=1 Tax=Rubroshorea leprosula TaxID=152421 RepID=A0AAV5LR05_9ROSI|nr:hypothetical protein SLEP1_g47591 [Rubroshorea leprosula]